MFTGLIESLGTITVVSPAPAGMRAHVRADIASQLVRGESLAVNGVCLTVVEAGAEGIVFDVAPETARVTTLGSLAAGTLVNLERSLRADARLGGHFVQGHVDATGTIAALRQEGESYRLTVGVPAAVMPLVVRKGSIALDGVSLTIASVDDGRNQFDVQIIPFTWQHTRVHVAQPGDGVNVECDILGKYVLRALERRDDSGVREPREGLPARVRSTP
jgi:riboflavin synthase alpha subunit